MATTYYALTELDGETPENPGGLVRMRRNGGLHLDVYLGGGQSDDRSQHLAYVAFEPGDNGVEKLTDEQAAKLIEAWPPSNLRSGFKRA